MYLEQWLNSIDGAYNSYNTYRFDWYDLRDKSITDPTLLEIRDNLRGIYYIFENLFGILPPPVLQSIWYKHVQNVGQGDNGDAVEFQLTMTAILEVMLTANPSQVEYFVALLDGYRQSIWNRPFNEFYYATIANMFKI